MTNREEPLVLSRHLRISGVKILAIQAAIDTAFPGDMQIEWSTRADNGGDQGIFVLGQLHATGMDTRSDVTVVAYCHLEEGFAGEVTEDILRAAALEGSVPHVLYDIAASASQQMVGLVQMKGALPRATPKAKWMDFGVGQETDSEG